MQEDDCLKLMNRIWVRVEGKVVSATQASKGLLTWWDKHRQNILLALENQHQFLVYLEENGIK